MAQALGMEAPPAGRLSTSNDRSDQSRWSQKPFATQIPDHFFLRAPPQLERNFPMNKTLIRQAQLMQARAEQLGLPVVVDQIFELMAAAEGFRNAHAWRAALDKREPAALVQECPDESGSDYKLVNGRGIWLSIGAFSVHPYLTDEGVVVDVYARGCEDGDAAASTWALTTDAEDAMLEHAEIDADTVAAWAQAQKSQDFHDATADRRCALIREFVQRAQVVAG